MPLKPTGKGEECPLGKFKIKDMGGYTSDRLESCIGSDVTSRCNFFRMSAEEESFDPSRQCQCPIDMSWSEYDILREEYIGKLDRKEIEHTGPETFWEYVNGNRLAERLARSNNPVRGLRMTLYPVKKQ